MCFTRDRLDTHTHTHIQHEQPLQETSVRNQVVHLPVSEEEGPCGHERNQVVLKDGVTVVPTFLSTDAKIMVPGLRSRILKDMVASPEFKPGLDLDRDPATPPLSTARRSDATASGS